MAWSVGSRKGSQLQISIRRWCLVSRRWHDHKQNGAHTEIILLSIIAGLFHRFYHVVHWSKAIVSQHSNQIYDRNERKNSPTSLNFHSLAWFVFKSEFSMVWMFCNSSQLVNGTSVQKDSLGYIVNYPSKINKCKLKLIFIRFESNMNNNWNLLLICRFNMDTDGIPDLEYLKRSILGGRQYCLKEPLTTLPKARRQMKM